MNGSSWASICQPSFARTKEKGHFSFDFLGFPDVLFHMYLCCFKKKNTNHHTEKKPKNKQKSILHSELVLLATEDLHSLDFTLLSSKNYQTVLTFNFNCMCEQNKLSTNRSGYCQFASYSYLVLGSNIYSNHHTKEPSRSLQSNVNKVGVFFSWKKSVSVGMFRMFFNNTYSIYSSIHILSSFFCWTRKIHRKKLSKPVV